MKVTMQLVITLAAAASASEAAMKPVSELKMWLTETAKADSNVDSVFSNWCTSAVNDREALYHQTASKVAAAERQAKALEELQARYDAQEELAADEKNATDLQRVRADGALSDERASMAKEVGFLNRATELAHHGLRLSGEDSSSPIVGLLSELLHMADEQKGAVQSEMKADELMLTNLSGVSDAAMMQVKEEVDGLTAEERERAREAARLSSQMADLRRLLTAADSSRNSTEMACKEHEKFVADNEAHTQESERAAVDSVQTVLDQLRPGEDVMTFLQVQQKSKLGSRAARLAAGLMQMAHHHHNPVLDRAAEILGKEGAALSVPDAAAVDSKSATKDDPLSEIAAFSTEASTDATFTVAKETYSNLKDSLAAQLADLKKEEDRCLAVAEEAKQGASAVHSAAARGAAELQVVSALASGRDADAKYLDNEVVAVRDEHQTMKEIKREEESAHDTVEKYSASAPVQLYTVATDLTAAGRKDVGASIEKLVTMVQDRDQAHVKRHATYQRWMVALDKDLSGLERALNSDAAHASRRANDAEAEKTYRSSMAGSAAQGEQAATEARDAATECDGKSADLTAKRQSIMEQEDQLEALWTHVQDDPTDFDENA